MSFNDFCYIQLFQNILTSTGVRFPQGALEELHADCVDLCRSLLRQNPGHDCYIKVSLVLCLCVFKIYNHSSRVRIYSYCRVNIKKLVNPSTKLQCKSQNLNLQLSDYHLRSSSITSFSEKLGKAFHSLQTVLFIDYGTFDILYNLGMC